MKINRCPQCNKEFDPKEKRCPHCGAAVRKYGIFKIVVLIIAAIVVFQIYPKITQMIRDRSRLDNIQPVMSVTAVELEKAYTADQTTADEQFKGKFITVSGRIEDIGKDMVGKFFITLQTERKSGGIQCLFDKAYKHEVLRKQKGMQVTIVGRCDGMIGKVQLRKCRFERNLQ